jgi:hypothetical protein
MSNVTLVIAGSIAAVVVAGLLGAWWGAREAERAFVTGQAPTLRRVREAVTRLRSFLERLEVHSGRPSGNTAALEEVKQLQRELLDLAAPSRRSSSSRAPQ